MLIQSTEFAVTFLKCDTSVVIMLQKAFLSWIILNGQQITCVNLPIRIENNLMPYNINTDMSEPKHPRIEIVVNLVLKLNIQPKPAGERSPKRFSVNNNIKKVNDILLLRVLRKNINGKSLLIFKSIRKLHYFSCCSVNNEL